MTEKAIFYHAGCGVCVDAEQAVADAIDPARYNVESVHLGEAPGAPLHGPCHGDHAG